MCYRVDRVGTGLGRVWDGFGTGLGRLVLLCVGRLGRVFFTHCRSIDLGHSSTVGGPLGNRLYPPNSAIAPCAIQRAGCPYQFRARRARKDDMNE
jgi:hypothetical protein